MCSRSVPADIVRVAYRHEKRALPSQVGELFAPSTPRKSFLRCNAFLQLFCAQACMEMLAYLREGSPLPPCVFSWRTDDSLGAETLSAGGAAPLEPPMSTYKQGPNPTWRKNIYVLIVPQGCTKSCFTRRARKGTFGPERAPSGPKGSPGPGGRAGARWIPAIIPE